MTTYWTSTTSRKWAARAVAAAFAAALAFTGLAVTSQAQAEASGVDKPISVRWR